MLLREVGIFVSEGLSGSFFSLLFPSWISGLWDLFDTKTFFFNILGLMFGVPWGFSFNRLRGGGTGAGSWSFTTVFKSEIVVSFIFKMSSWLCFSFSVSFLSISSSNLDFRLGDKARHTFESVFPDIMSMSSVFRRYLVVIKPGLANLLGITLVFRIAVASSGLSKRQDIS